MCVWFKATLPGGIRRVSRWNSAPDFRIFDRKLTPKPE
jgi:hypothetical protein